MKKLMMIIVVIVVCSIKCDAPTKHSNWDVPQYLTTGRNMSFRIYPENYKARMIEKILNEDSTIK